MVLGHSCTCDASLIMFVFTMLGFFCCYLRFLFKFSLNFLEMMAIDVAQQDA